MIKNAIFLFFLSILLGCSSSKSGGGSTKNNDYLPPTEISPDLLKGMTKNQLQAALNKPYIMETGALLYEKVQVTKGGDVVTLLFKGGETGEQDFTFKSNNFTRNEDDILESFYSKDKVTKNMACYNNECFPGKTKDAVIQKIIDEYYPPRRYDELKPNEKLFVDTFIENAKFGDIKITDKNTLKLYSETLPTSLNYSNFGSILKEEIYGGVMDKTNQRIYYFAYGDTEKIKPFNDNKTYSGKTFATAEYANETGDYIQKRKDLTGTATLTIDIKTNTTSDDNVEKLTIDFKDYLTLNYINKKYDSFSGGTDLNDSDFNIKGTKNSGWAEYNGYSNINTTPSPDTPEEAVGVYQFNDGEIYNGIKINGSFGVKKQ